MVKGEALLRAKQKEERRQKILDAAEHLIRESGSTHFTMLDLAKQANISPTTPYNLFGSKGAVLYTLLNRALDDLILGGEANEASGSPIEAAVHSMTRAADLFIGDPALFRPLYKFQLGENALMDRPHYMQRVLVMWRRSVDGLLTAGYLAEHPSGAKIGRDDFALALLTHSIGVLDLWVQEELQDAEFRARMAHDTALLLFSVAKPQDRKMLYRIISEARENMANAFAFQKAGEAG